MKRPRSDKPSTPRVHADDSSADEKLAAAPVRNLRQRTAQPQAPDALGAQAGTNAPVARLNRRPAAHAEATGLMAMFGQPTTRTVRPSVPTQVRGLTAMFAPNTRPVRPSAPAKTERTEPAQAQAAKRARIAPAQEARTDGDNKSIRSNQSVNLLRSSSEDDASTTSASSRNSAGSLQYTGARFPRSAAYGSKAARPDSDSETISVGDANRLVRIRQQNTNQAGQNDQAPRAPDDVPAEISLPVNAAIHVADTDAAATKRPPIAPATAARPDSDDKSIRSNQSINLPGSSPRVDASAASASTRYSAGSLEYNNVPPPPAVPMPRGTDTVDNRKAPPAAAHLAALRQDGSVPTDITQKAVEKTSAEKQTKFQLPKPTTWPPTAEYFNAAREIVKDRVKAGDAENVPRKLRLGFGPVGLENHLKANYEGLENLPRPHAAHAAGDATRPQPAQAQLDNRTPQLHHTSRNLPSDGPSIASEDKREMALWDHAVTKGNTIVQAASSESDGETISVGEANRRVRIQQQNTNQADQTNQASQARDDVPAEITLPANASDTVANPDAVAINRPRQDSLDSVTLFKQALAGAGESADPNSAALAETVTGAPTSQLQDPMLIDFAKVFGKSPDGTLGATLLDDAPPPQVEQAPDAEARFKTPRDEHGDEISDHNPATLPEAGAATGATSSQVQDPLLTDFANVFAQNPVDSLGATLLDDAPPPQAEQAPNAESRFKTPRDEHGNEISDREEGLAPHINEAAIAPAPAAHAANAPVAPPEFRYPLPTNWPPSNQYYNTFRHSIREHMEKYGLEGLPAEFTVGHNRNPKIRDFLLATHPNLVAEINARVADAAQAAVARAAAAAPPVAALPPAAAETQMQFPESQREVDQIRRAAQTNEIPDSQNLIGYLGLQESQEKPSSNLSDLIDKLALPDFDLDERRDRSRSPSPGLGL